MKRKLYENIDSVIKATRSDQKDSTWILTKRAAFLTSILSVTGCPIPNPKSDTVDNDGDGFDQYYDCNDNDSSINPSAEELCDTIDNNCDGNIDETSSSNAKTWYADSDADTFGDNANTIKSCSQPTGYVSVNTDCNDANPYTNPSASEICDGIDNDCSGDIDDKAIDAKLFYSDSDSDGYGDLNSNTECCDIPSGYSDNSSDCDDTNANVNPSHTEDCWDSVDNDCDGIIDEDCDELSLANADAKFLGERANDMAGWSISGGGDVNNDGYDDILIGAPFEAFGGSSGGSVYLINGPVSGEINLSSTNSRLSAHSANDHAGMSVSSAGDVNRDGYDDILIGAQNESTNGTYAGAAYLVLGPITENLELSDADFIFYGEENSYTSSSVSGAGDINGDSYPDIIIGAMGNEYGKTYLVYGPFSSNLQLSTESDSIMTGTLYDASGYKTAGVGDVNADGFDDILIGAINADQQAEDPHESRGAAYLVNGPIASDIDLSTESIKIAGAKDGDAAGSSVAGGGDVNNDGYMDMLVSATQEDSGGSYAGAVYLLEGPLHSSFDLSSFQAKFIGERSGDRAGNAVSIADDVNGDGYADILIGAYSSGIYSDQAGTSYLIFGPASGEIDLYDANAKFSGENTYDASGFSISGYGDINGDGFSDILIGAYGISTNGSYAGGGYLKLGSGI